MLALLVYCLSAADVAFTRYGISRGVIAEVNPLMAWLFATDPRLGVGLGIAVPAVALGIISRLQRESPWASRGLWLLLIVKGAVLALHAAWLIAFVL